MAKGLKTGAASPLLEVVDLSVSFFHMENTTKAVDRVSFSLQAGRSTGVMGESGSGKSTLGQALLRLVPRTGRITGGRVLLKGRDLMRLSESEMRKVRGRCLGLIFQEPGAALNPLARIGTQMTEGPKYHFKVKDSATRRAASELLQEVGISEPDRCMASFPHELSVGMQQRVLLAAALLCQPDLLIADEPTASLDSVTEFQVLDLLARTTRVRQVALLMISHDWNVLRRVTDRVLVMREGRIVGEGSVQEIGSESEPYIRGEVTPLSWTVYGFRIKPHLSASIHS